MNQIEPKKRKEPEKKNCVGGGYNLHLNGPSHLRFYRAVACDCRLTQTQCEDRICLHGYRNFSTKIQHFNLKITENLLFWTYGVNVNLYK